jgi:hypothetical protein
VANAAPTLEPRIGIVVSSIDRDRRTRGAIRGDAVIANPILPHVEAGVVGVNQAERRLLTRDVSAICGTSTVRMHREGLTA